MTKSKRGFYFFTGDVNWLDYGGTWIREIPGSNGLRYHVLQFDNWNEYGSEHEYKYMIDLAEVDLGTMPEDQIKSAMKCCDVKDAPETTEAEVAYACFAYGAKAPLMSESGNNSRALINAAKKYSYELTSNPDAYADAMDRPVNAIGSTAREFMIGDLNSPILRGLAAGDPRADLMARLGMLGRKGS